MLVVFKYYFNSNSTVNEYSVRCNGRHCTGTVQTKGAIRDGEKTGLQTGPEDNHGRRGGDVFRQTVPDTSSSDWKSLATDGRQPDELIQRRLERDLVGNFKHPKVQAITDTDATIQSKKSTFLGNMENVTLHNKRCVIKPVKGLKWKAAETTWQRTISISYKTTSFKIS